MRRRTTWIIGLTVILVLAGAPLQRSHAAEITVDTTSDVLDAAADCEGVTPISLPGPDAETSLREAICAANNNPGPDMIGFDIPGIDERTIWPDSGLPRLTDDQTTIDGYSQPGASPATASSPAMILIEISGSSAGLSNGLEIESAGNLIRGLAIKNFAGNGIVIGYPTATGNVISGNYIGLNWSGGVDAGNGLDGVFVGLGATDNLIGGDEPAERNVISGNEYEGVAIHGTGTVSNTISGNYIGTAADGTTALGNNLYAGVRVYGGAQNNIIGGETPGERNVISGNVEDGVRIVGVGTTGNTVTGNYIGTDPSGLAALGNGENGVFLAGGAQNNMVGGGSDASRNVISGNDSDGVEISDSDTFSNTVSGNYIGVDATGTGDLGNGYFGVHIVNGAQFNRIGGGSETARNILSGNDDCGVAICGAGTSSNTVSGNFIGTDSSGAVALGNAWYGVYICEGAHDNVIGGDLPGERNVVSANINGIYITDEGTTGNTVSGNYVGVNADGTTALGNTHSGVGIYSDAQYNTIGGDNPGEGNIISGNDDYGIQIGNPGTAFNTVTGNYIGTDASGVATLPNGRNGIDLYNNSHDNTLGPGNVIVGSGAHGIEISGSGADNNIVLGNYIGVDASGTLDLGNTENGIYITGSADFGIVGPGNFIAHNDLAGVAVRSDTCTGHTITQNSIYANEDLGIDLIDGANNDIAAPTITDAPLGPFRIEGMACPGCTVEVFANSTADGEGEFYVGSTLADGSGVFSLIPGSIPHPHLTATATDPTDGTSEFSPLYTASIPVLATSTKTVDRTTASPGEALTYTITLTNSGTATATVMVTDTLPAEVTWADVYSVSVGTLTWDAGENRLLWSGMVEVGLPVTIAYRVTVNADVPVFTQIVNTASVDSDLGFVDQVGPARVTVISHSIHLPLVLQ